MNFWKNFFDNYAVSIIDGLQKYKIYFPLSSFLSSNLCLIIIFMILKGNKYLTVTWKINENCFQNIEVDVSIEKRLVIDGKEYEDIDEILNRLIDPIAGFVLEIMSHKYYNPNLNNNTKTQEIELENIEHFLSIEKNKNKIKIPYVFTCCRQFPGKFMLSYILQLKYSHEYITIKCEGFKFREKLFVNFNEFVSWFKIHHIDPLLIVSLASPSLSNNKNMELEDGKKKFL